MKLHQIKLPAKIYEKVSDGSKFFTVDHLDGLYSYCESEKGGVCHLHVMEELEPYKDGYKFKAPHREAFGNSNKISQENSRRL